MKQRLALVTGASGFLGRYVVQALNAKGICVRAVSRRPSAEAAVSGPVEWRQGDLHDPAGWPGLLDGVDTVVHLAALTGSETVGHLLEFNAVVTGRLARQASAAGIGHFVYVSSVRVYGHARLISEATPTSPADPYGRSKFAGEEKVIEVAAAGTMRYAVLRPPFVYGADRAGLLSLMYFAARTGLPLPLGGLNNRRSLIFVGNLADAVATAAEASEIHGYALPVAEDGDWTYAGLFAELAAHHGRSAVTWPFPRQLFKIAGRLSRRQETVKRMLEDCIVDGTAFSKRLNWTPPYAPGAALRSAFTDMSQLHDGM
jgi:nucleoside-diphosphate-sugar epimerase